MRGEAGRGPAGPGNAGLGTAWLGHFMSDALFQPKGNTSQVEACLQVFRALPPGDWVSEQDLHIQVREITGTDVPLNSLLRAAWHAGERLPRSQELGVDTYKGGYKRHTAVALAEAAEVRLDRAIRDLGRLDTRTRAALQQPDLPAPYRNRMEQLRCQNVRQVALSAKRQTRHRPLPPGGST